MPIKMSVTSGGGGAGWWVQISTLIHFNTPFRSCFTKKVTSILNYYEKQSTFYLSINVSFF